MSLVEIDIDYPVCPVCNAICITCDFHDYFCENNHNFSWENNSNSLVRMADN